jgi:hypothetical protein
MNCKACGRKPNLKHCLGNYLKGKRDVTKYTVSITGATVQVFPEWKHNVNQMIYV